MFFVLDNWFYYVDSLLSFEIKVLIELSIVVQTYIHNNYINFPNFTSFFEFVIFNIYLLPVMRLMTL